MTKAQEAWERAAKYSERAQVTTDEENAAVIYLPSKPMDQSC
jgi:hypothetical protein